MDAPRRTALVTDSTVSLPPSLAAELGISVVPLFITLGSQSYRDGVDITPGQIYQAQRRGALPKTSAPNPAGFLNAFESAASDGSEAIVCVVTAGRYSSVVNSAQTAALQFSQDHPDVSLQIVDSGTAAGGLAVLMLATARICPPDAESARVEAVVRRLQAHCFMLATIDSLYYVARGGHVPRVAAWAGDLLQVKPIMEMAPGGEVHRLERPRTRRRALERLVALTMDRAKNRPILMNVVHADAADEAADLKAKVAQEFRCTDLLVTEFSPVIGAHTGPGLLGLAFWVDL